MPRGLAALLVAAAALRLAACDRWGGDLSADPDAYREYASRLAAGEGYVSASGSATAFRPPLYPVLLAGTFWAGPAGVAALQIGLGVATVGLTGLAGARLGLGSWSLLAAALVALDPLLLRYTPQVMTEVTCAFFAALLLYLAAGAGTCEKRDRTTSPPSPSPLSGTSVSRLSSLDSRLFPLGVAFGAATLSRPTFWAFGFLAVAFWVWGLWIGRRGNSVGALRRALPVALGTALAVAPWGVRNAFALGRPVLTTTHGGYTLLLANNPTFWAKVVMGPPGAVWEGESLAAWQQSLERQMAAAGVPGDEVSRDRWFSRRAKDHIRNDPGAFGRAAAYRLKRFWALTPAVERLTAPAKWAVAGYYGITFALAAFGAAAILVHAGLGRSGREAAAAWRPALLLIAAFTAVHAVYWTDTRMRAPLTPAVALLAASGARRLWPVSPFRESA